MNHDHARELIDRQHVEGLSAAGRESLEEHLEACAECARVAAVTSQALHSLRSVSVPVPPALAARTQLRVYLRAHEMRGPEHGWALWIAFGISWVMGLASAPYVWRAFHWLGSHAGLPDPLWKMGFALWWALPALLAVGVLLVERWGKAANKRSDYVQ
jgi:hypothetical protein